MSLRWRIAAVLGLIAAIVSALGATGAYFSTRSQLEGSVDDSLRTISGNLDHGGSDRFDGGSDGQTGNRTATTPTATANVAQPVTTTGAPAANASNPSNAGAQPPSGPDGFTHPAGCPPAGEFQPAVAAYYVAADGTVTECIEGGPSLPAKELRSAAPGSAPRLWTVDVGGQPYRLASVAAPGGGTFVIARGLDEVESVLGSLRRRLVLLGVGGVALAAILGWLIARRTMRPVEELRVATERIAASQDLTTPVPVSGPAEIGSLARSFTTMVGALAESREQQHQLVRDASHELRTPLTSLRTNSELLGRADELDSHEYDQVVERVQLEVGELDHLVGELVDLATDGSGNDGELQPLELRELAGEVADRFRRRSGRAVDVVTVDGGADTVMARGPALERALSNLVENALKYSPSGPVEIVVDGTSVEVRDRGPGIAAEDRPRVFDRFYRAVGTRSEPGSGLGLAIVKQVVERHGGTVFAAERPGGGAIVGFTLPTLPADGGSAPRAR
jgi:two-component system sensor histidine kinase MprB